VQHVQQSASLEKLKCCLLDRTATFRQNFGCQSFAHALDGGVSKQIQLIQIVIQLEQLLSRIVTTSTLVLEGHNTRESASSDLTTRTLRI
jgi:hypothetical protein